MPIRDILERIYISGFTRIVLRFRFGAAASAAPLILASRFCFRVAPAVLAAAAGVVTPAVVHAQTPTLTVEDVSAEEGEDLVFTITLTGATSSAFKVTPNTVSGTARGSSPYNDFRISEGSQLLYAGNDGETHTYTVPSVEDTNYEDDETFTVTLTADDDGVDDSDTATGTIENDDTASLTVEDVIVSEAQSATFEVQLNNSEPRNLEVIITFEDGSATGGTIGDDGVDYKNTSQRVKFGADDQPGARRQAPFNVTIADDELVEPTEDFTVRLALAEPDPNIDVSDLATGIIVDNDFSAVTARPVPGQEYREGDDQTFAVTLLRGLVRGFQVDVTFTDGSAIGGVDYDNTPRTLTFDGDEGETHTFDVTTVDDAIVEGEENFDVVLTIASGSEHIQRFLPALNGTGSAIVDNDVPAVTVSPTALDLDPGGTGTYSVVLDLEPHADVTITASSGDAGVATVSSTSLTFTPSDWNVARTVTVTGAGEGSAAISHSASGGGYDGATIDGVDVAVISSSPGLVFSRTSVGVNEGSTATYTVALATEPTAQVTVPITGAGQGVGASPTRLTFTAANWSTAQTVTVTAAEDSNTGSETVTLTHAASGGDYDGVSGDVTVSTIDNDTVIPASPALVFSRTSVPVNEGSTATYTVALAAVPSAQVTVTITGAGQGVGASPTRLTFTAANWSTAQTVTVTAAEDSNTASERVTLTHAASGGGYDGVSGDVTVSTIDNDTIIPASPGLVFSRTSVAVNEGSTATYTVALATVPTGQVTLPITGAGQGVGASPARLTFTAANWSTAQTVTVTAAEDSNTTSERVTLTHTASGGGYDGVSGDVTVSTIDNDTAPPPIVPPPTEPPPTEPPPANHPPTVTAECDPCTVRRGGQVRLTATASDPDGDELTLAWSAPQGRFEGAATGAAAQWTAPGETGRVTIRVEVSDGRGGAAAAEVVIEVVNDQPTVTAECDPCTVRPGGEVRLTATASDPDGDELTFAWSAPQGRFEGAATGAAAQWTAPGETGRVTIRVEVSDGWGGMAAAEVVVEVVNKPPSFEASVYAFELRENLDGRQRPVTLGSVTGEDPDGDTLTYELQSGDRERFAIGEHDGVATYIGPGEDFESEPNRYELSVSARDPYGAKAQAQVVVTVTNVNEFPEANDDEARTREDEPVTVDVLANDTDPDGDALHVETVSAAGHGTAKVVPGGGVVYTPEANYHGPDRFTYVVSDGAGGTAEAAVEVRVLPVNDAPAAVGTIPDQALDEGGEAMTVELGPYFDDADGDPLSYRAVSSDTAVVTVSASGETLTLTPVEYGEATVRVTAEDPDGRTAAQTFAVDVSDRLVRAVIGDTLAAMARSHLASARMTLGRRVRAGSSKRAELRVMGRTVPLTPAAMKRLLAGEWPLDGRQGRYAGSAGLAGFGELAGGGSWGAATLGESVEGRMWPGAAAAGRSGFGGGVGDGDGSDRWLSGTEFVLAWGGSEEGGETRPGRSWQLWGQGDMQTFQGARSAAAAYDGDLRTGYLGVDTWLSDRWLTGVAVSRSRGAGGWRVGSSRGTLASALTAVHPYLHWSDGRTSVSAMGGGGRGAVENVRQSGRLGTSGLGLGLGLVEARRSFGAAGGGAEFGLRGDAGWAQLATEAGAETIDAHRVAVTQARFGADVSRPVRMRTGLTLAPFGAAHVRRDGGAGQTGTGVELMGGLRAARGRVRLDAQGRVLVLHSAAGYRERGVGVTLSVGNRKRTGLSLSLSPRWGDSVTGTDTLWQDQLYRGYGRGAGSGDWGVDARADYGVQMPGGGRLNWFGSFSRSPYGSGIAVGVRINTPVDRHRPRERVAGTEPPQHSGTPLTERR